MIVWSTKSTAGLMKGEKLGGDVERFLCEVGLVVMERAVYRGASTLFRGAELSM